MSELLMSMCPWCKSHNPPRAEVCLKCGKKAADHPSMSGSDLPDTFGDDGGPPLAAIELGGQGPAVAGSFDASGAGGGMQTFGDDWGEGEAPPAGPSLDLASDIPNRSSTKQAVPGPVASPPSSRREAGPPRRASSGGMQAGGDGGGAAPAERTTIEIDRFEILAFADYGAEPKSIFYTLPYAIRVKRRQRELRRALAGVRLALKDAESRRDDRCVELGELLRPHVEADAQFGSFKALLGDAEKTKQTREQALAEASSSFRERAALIDADVAAQEAPLAAAQREVAEKERLANEADQLRGRHEARRKRVEIETRNAAVTLERPDALGPQRAQARAVIQAAQQEKDARAAEERQAAAVAQEAEGRAAGARRARAEVEGRIGALRKKRRDLEGEYARQGEIRTQGIDAASKDVRHAFLQIGRRLATGGLDVPGADIRRKAIAEAEANVKRLQIELEKHLRALDAADPVAVKKGLILLVAIVVVLLGSFIAWRALRKNPYVEDRPSTTSTKPSK